MIFGGIQKTSLIDFPAKISCVLFTPGCNFTCPYCHNPDLAQNRLERLSPLQEDEIIDFLKARRGLLEGVVITGGEPTLQEGLDAFCEKVKKLGFPVKLDTNGSRPVALKKLLRDRLVDYVAMDIKTAPGRYTPHFCKTDPTERLEESIDAVLSSGLAHEFRTTCLAPMVDIDAVEKIARRIAGADLYVLQHFRGDVVLDPDFIDKETTPFREADFLAFQSVAASFVERCLVR